MQNPEKYAIITVAYLLLWGDKMKKTVLNTRWFVKPMFLVIFWCLYFAAGYHQSGKDATPYIIGSIIVLCFFFLSPISYTFDEQYLSINYIFGYHRKFKWESITKIERGNTRYDYTSYQITSYKLNKGIYEHTASIIANKNTSFYIKKFWQGDFKA